jgi:hypothetical protein
MLQVWGDFLCPLKSETLPGFKKNTGRAFRFAEIHNVAIQWLPQGLAFIYNSQEEKATAQ